jgi:hypothetical protein
MKSRALKNIKREARNSRIFFCGARNEIALFDSKGNSHGIDLIALNLAKYS